MSVVSLGLGSLSVGGSLTIVGLTIQFVNDSVTPGANQVYATDGSGVKGWRALSAFGVTTVAGTAGQVLVNGGTTATSGAVTFTLASALTSINSITSAAGQNLVLAVGTGGTALTLTSSTLAATFGGPVKATFTGPSYFSVGQLALTYFGLTGADALPTTSNYAFAANSANTNTVINTDTGGSINLRVANTTKITLDSSGNTTLTSPTASTSTSTGALVVSGGVGVAGALYVGSSLTLNTPSASLAAITFADSSPSGLTWSFGPGVSTGSPTGFALRSSSVGANVFSVSSDGDGVFRTTLTVSGTTASTSTTTGSLINAGGFGNAGAFYNGGAAYVNGTIQVTANTTPAAGSGLEIQGGANPVLFAYDRTGAAYLPLITYALSHEWRIGPVVKMTLAASSGDLTLASATASTSTTTGSLINAGGFGNAGAAYIGGNLNVIGGTAGLRESIFMNTTDGTTSAQRVSLYDHTGVYGLSLYAFAESYTTNGPFRPARGAITGSFDLSFVSAQHRFWIGTGGRGDEPTGATQVLFLNSADAQFTVDLRTGGTTISSTTGAITLGSASSITAAASTDLTLAGGSSGASLVLGNTSGIATFNRNVLLATTTSTELNLSLVNTKGSGQGDVKVELTKAANGFSAAIWFEKTGAASTTLWQLGTGISAVDDIFKLRNGDGTIIFQSTNAAGHAMSVFPGADGNLLIGGTTDISGSGNLAVYGGTILSSQASGAALLIAKGSTEGDLILQDTGATSGQQVWNLNCDGGNLHIRTLGDAFSSPVTIRATFNASGLLTINGGGLHVANGSSDLGLAVGGNVPLAYTSAFLRTGNDFRLVDDGTFILKTGTTTLWTVTAAGAGILVGALTTQAGRRLKTSVVTTTTTLDTTYHVVVGNHATVAFTINLPGSPTAGDTFVIKNKGAALVTLAGNGANLFTTATSATMSLNTGDSVIVTYDGTVWAVC